MKKCKFIFILFSFIIIFIGFINVVRADRVDKTIKIGYIDHLGFIEKESYGKYKGYGVEYLDEISKYTGWKYEYVYDTWVNCLEKLKKGEIDLICTSQYTEDRDKYFKFSQYPAGYEVGVLYVDENKKNIYYNDIESFDGMRIGMVDKLYQNELLENFANSNFFNYTSFYYDSDFEMKNALKNGEIDAIVTGSLSLHNDLKVVAKLGVDPFYFISSENNEKLIDKVDLAIKNIKSENPYFDLELQKKYYNTSDFEKKPELTREDVNYIEKKRTLSIGCEKDWYPYIYMDKNTKKIKGILISLLEDISKKSGLKFRYVPVNSIQDAYSKLESKRIDVIAGYTQDIRGGMNNKLTLTDGYFDSQYSIVSRHAFIKDVKKLTLGATVSAKQYDKEIKKSLGIKNIEYYRNLQECINAINHNKTDFTIIDKYVSNELIKNIRTNNVVISNDINYTVPIQMALKENEETILVGILNKSIACISHNDLTNALNSVEERNDTVQSFDWKLFIKEYFDVIIIFLITFSILLIRLRDANRKKVIKAKHHDTLTDCYNLNYFVEKSPQILKNYGCTGYYLIKFDIYKFKNINSYYGNKIGDNILKKIAHEGKKLVRKGELFGRLAEDNFLLLVKFKDDLPNTKILNSIFENIKLEMNLELPLSFKAGFYKIEDINEHITDMLEKASIAHRSIKGNLKSFYAIYNKDLEKKILIESKIEIERESALENNEFKVYLQPKVDLKTFKILGAEALIRWIKKDGSMVYPDKFIPIFENDGFIEKIDLFVLEEVCKYLYFRKEKGEPLFAISVNQSRHLLNNINYINFIFEILNKYSIDSSLIEIEITETLYMENKDILLKIIEKLREKNIRISIDDFGSGYSSLNLITELPADILKIDRTFLVGSEESKVKNKVIKKVVQLAHELDMKVVCEGVETIKQEEFLCGIRCDMAQGYLYSKPIPISDFENLIYEKNK